MPFQPNFMLNLEQFHKDRENVQTLDDWLVFNKKWLIRTSWPKKARDVRLAEAQRKKGPVVIGDRVWSFTNFNYDISAEARYEFFFTLRVVGWPLKFSGQVGLPKTTENSFYQECPYCEILTTEIGVETCPQCERKLLYHRFSD